jgi:uncharacterized membrane protein
MSKEKEMQIIAANFETIDGAKLALEAIKESYVERGHAAILTKSAEGKVKVKDTFNWGVFAGSFGGAAVGVILMTILGGPAGLGVAVVGGVVGGIIGKKKYPNFPTAELKNMAESLEPDHSMLVLLTDAASTAQAERILAESGGQHISHPVSAELIADVQQALADAEADDEDVETS